MPAISDSVIKVFEGHPLKDGRVFRGSAFLIGRHHLLTCRHVIGSTSAKDLFLLNDRAWADGGVRGVKSVTLLDGRDVAVLRLDIPADHYLDIGTHQLSKGDEVALLGCDDKTGARSIQTMTTHISGNDGVHNLFLTDDQVQEGISGGPAVFKGKVVGIVQAKETAHALIIPCSAFREFVQECVGDLTACAELLAFPPSEMLALKNLLQGIDPNADACLSLCMSIVGNSRIPDPCDGNMLWSCVDFLSKKPHISPSSAPLFTFIMGCCAIFTEDLEIKLRNALQAWCISNAERLSIDMSTITKAANHGNAFVSSEVVLTIVIEPLDLVSETKFLLKAWLWKDNDFQQCFASDMPVSRHHLEQLVSEIVRSQRRMLGVEGSRMQLELAVPYCLFSWNLNHVRFKAGSVVEFMGSLHPVSFRSWERLYRDEEFDMVRDRWPKRWGDAINLSDDDGELNLFDADSPEDCIQTLYDKLMENQDSAWGFVAHFAIDEKTDVVAVAGLFGAAFAAGIPLAFWTHGSCDVTKTLRKLVSKLFVEHKRDLLPFSLRDLRLKMPDPWNNIAMLCDNPERLPPDIEYTLVTPH